MADIAKAYVQIVPTTKDIASNIKKALNGADVENVGESLAQKMSNGFKKAIISTGLAVFIGKTIGDAIKNGADFEQYFGGAEKIFDGMNINSILSDSVEAYKTMGMSANQYLKVINDVGAAFKANMGSEAGYETAKKGLQAISDYASGTGKSVDELSQKFTMITRSTSSYQSIADQFSGVLPATSKAFLEQAQAAGDLGKQYKSLTEVPIAEYQGAVASALERGVGALNLTGNTAMEASKTVSGSIGAMKAAWSTFTTSLSIPEIDTSEAFSNFVNSFHDLINNLTPMIEEMAPNIANALGLALVELGPVIINIIGETIGSVLGSLPEMFGKLDISGAAVVITASLAGIAKAIVALAPTGEILAEIGASIVGLINPISLLVIAILSIPVAVTALTRALTDLWVNSKAFEQMVDAEVQLYYKLHDAFISAGVAIGSLKNKLTELKDNMSNVFSQVVSIAISKINEFKNKVRTGIQETISNTAKTLVEFVSNFKEVFKTIIESVASWKDELISKIKDTISTMTSEAVKKAKELPSKFKEIGKNMAEGIKKGFEDDIDSVIKGVEKAVNKVVEKLKKLLGIQSPSKLFKEQVGAMMAAGIEVGFTEEMQSASIQILDSLKDLASETGQDYNTLFSSIFKNPGDWYKYVGNSISYSENGKEYVIENKVVIEGELSKLLKAIKREEKMQFIAIGY